ncbi:hypothetical protein [Ornithinimicrobium faecis]|uniref:hypothetical protein n=1 Tax=Ornithinimicrobium faecis TaxID=2934158 RepID=UPI0021181BD6|nr:hypothetical protein [Ornithinimicrobium sp. HY1745]
MPLAPSRALGILTAAATLVTGLAAPSVTPQPNPDDSPPVFARSSVGGVEVVTEDGQVAGLVTSRAGGPGIVQTTQVGDATLLTPTDPTGVPTQTVHPGAEGDLLWTDDGAGVTTLAPSAVASADIVETPDYCRDPANGNPTQPGPGKVAVTIDALDRGGGPAGGSFTMMDFHCEPYEANGYISFGLNPGEPRTFYVPPGTYSLLGYATTLDESGSLAQEVTFGGDPQFDVVAGEPLALTVDARDGEPLVVDTAQPSTPSIVVLGWERGIEGNPPLSQSTVIYPQSSSVSQISLIPSEPVTDGVFSFFPWLRNTEPWTSVRAVGGGEPADLQTRLLNPMDAPAVEGMLPVRVGLDGLVPGDAALLHDGPALVSQVAAAEAAGASVVLIGPAQEGLTEPRVTASLPLLTLPSGDAADLADRIERLGGVGRIHVTVDANPDYVYDLIDELPTVDADPFGTLTSGDLTTVHQTFHTDGNAAQAFETRGPSTPCRCLLTPIFDIIEPGSTRVDHVINNGSTWQQTVIHGAALQTKTPPTAYDGTTDPDRHWLAGALGSGAAAGTVPTDPRAPATTASGQLRLRLGPVDGAGHAASGPFQRAGTISRDGVVVAPTFAGTAQVDAPAGPAPWRIELVTTHAPILWNGSSRVESIWEFVAGASTDEIPTALPLVEAQTSFPVDAHSQRIARGMLEVTPWRVDGVPLRRADVQVELSWDDGASWSQERGHLTRGVWKALPTRGDGSVDVRITVRDGDGSMLTRTVEDAWVD